VKHFNPILKKTCVAMGLGFCAAVSAAPVQVDFGTLAMTGKPAFSTVLANAGIIPTSSSPLAAVHGSFTYDDATPGVTNLQGTQRTFNGAVDALSFTAGSWMSQALTGIGDTGDIVVSRNAGANLRNDSISVTVSCAAPLPNNTTRSNCAPSSGNFSYSFTDPTTGTIWALDRFTLLLQETGALTEPLNDLALPSSAEWLSPVWKTERVTLRFNPFGPGIGNETLTGTIDFMAVPEPGSLALMGVALLGVVAVSRRRREARA